MKKFPSRWYFVVSRSILYTIAVGSLFASVSSGAQEQQSEAQTLPVISSFLNEVGDVKDKRKTHLLDPAQYALFKNFPDSFIDYRIVKDRNEDALQTANVARVAFGRECISKGGVIDDDSEPNVQALLKHGLARTSEYDNNTHWNPSERWHISHRVAICSANDATVMGVMIAYVHDVTASYSYFTNPKRRPYNIALIAAMKPRHGTSKAFQRMVAARNLEADRLAQELGRQSQQRVDRAAQQRAIRLVEFKKNIAIGTATNCGLVINVRGPLAEIQLPANVQGPNGQTIYWVRRDMLTFDPPMTGCDLRNRDN